MDIRVSSEETNFYYLNSRYYHPEIHRFISPDSFEYIDESDFSGLNLYCYCLNNPVMYVDPSGHAPKWWQWLIGGIGLTLIVVAAGLAILGTGAAVGFAIGGAIGASAYSLALGTNFGKMGTVVEHPGIKVNWSKSMIHGPERMFQRGVTKRVVNSTVRRGIALSQAGGKFAFVTQKAVVVVSSSGVLITTYGKVFYDAGMLEIIKVLFGG